MASFSVTYNHMLKWDIKHTHFGRPQHLQFRGSEHPNMAVLRRMKENRELKLNLIKGSAIYQERQLKEAPAFRLVSRHEIDGIIDRVRKPTASSLRRSHGFDEFESPQEQSPSSLTPRDMNAITSRLCNPTHMSTLRAERDPTRIINVENRPLASQTLAYTRQQAAQKTSPRNHQQDDDDF